METNQYEELSEVLELTENQKLRLYIYISRETK